MYLFTESYTCARSECCAVFTEYIAGVNDVEFNLSSVQGRGGGAVQFFISIWEHVHFYHYKYSAYWNEVQL